MTCLNISGSAGGRVGYSWQSIPGRLKQIDSGPIGFVWGVNEGYKIYFRKGVTWKKPEGSKWIRVKGRFKHVSVGQLGPWAVSPKNYVFFRLGVTRRRPEGIKE